LALPKGAEIVCGAILVYSEGGRGPTDHLKVHAGGPSPPTCRGKKTRSPLLWDKM